MKERELLKLYYKWNMVLLALTCFNKFCRVLVGFIVNVDSGLAL